MSIQIETEGRRTYIVGNTYPVRDQIRALGAHWDSERKAWWTAKAEEARQLAERLNGAQTAPAASQGAPSSKAPRDGLNSVVAGRATYKGHTYYVAGRTAKGRTHWDDRVEAITTQDGQKVLLYFRDGSSQFWAPLRQFGDRVTVAEMATTPPDVVCIVKSYDRPQTIRGLQRFAEQARKDAADGITPELRAAYRHGWDGKIGSASYYSSGAFDEIDQ